MARLIIGGDHKVRYILGAFNGLLFALLCSLFSASGLVQ